MPTPSPLSFPRAHRLSGKRQFAAVYDHRLRKHAGPLALAARPNGLGHHRLGLSVSRRVGGAVKRNRIKRLLREAFRLNQRSWPGAYDLVVMVRPHDTMTLEDYARLLGSAAVQVDREQRRRDRRSTRDAGAPPGAEA